MAVDVWAKGPDLFDEVDEFGETIPRDPYSAEYASWQRRHEAAIASGGKPPMQTSARLAYSDDQPRDEMGRFGEGDGDTKAEPGTAENPITGITDADEALALIAEGKYVEMDPDMVAVSLDRLAAISRDARERGEKAPLYDLCNITSDNTSLFCGSSVVESRLDMPQLGGVPTPGSPADSYEKDDKGEVDLTGRFLEQLASEGVSATPTEVDAGLLKASQNQINGAKVAGMMTAIQSGTMPTGAIMVSRDNYVIDGHHRWAAEVGTKYTGGARLTMPIVRIDMPIQQVLERANAFAAGQGMPQMQASLGARLGYSEDQPRDESGRFGEGSGESRSDARERVDATIKLEEMLPNATVNLGSLAGPLAPQLVESVGRATSEFPALRDSIRAVEVTSSLPTGVMGSWYSGDGKLAFAEQYFGGRPDELAQRLAPGEQMTHLEERWNAFVSGTLQDHMEGSGAFHPLNDAQATFDHELGHAVWDAAARAGEEQYHPSAFTTGGRMTDEELTLRSLGFNPQDVYDRGYNYRTGEQKPESQWKVPTQRITGALRTMGSTYGAKSYTRKELHGGFVEPARSLNEGFAEWFSVRQREGLRDALDTRTKPIVGDAFAKVIDLAKAASARTAAFDPEYKHGDGGTCVGYVPSELWEAMTPAEQEALIPQAEARLAYSEDQARDEAGRFGEGDGASSFNGRSIVDTVREQGGITVRPLDGSSPTTGYVVARPDVKGETPSADDFFGPNGPAMISAFMDAHADQLDEPGAYLGLWHDTEHGEVALDVVEVIEDRDAAIAAGAERDEQAIWDVAGGVEIPTGGTGGREASAASSIGAHYAAAAAPPREAPEAVAGHDARGEAGVGGVDSRSDAGGARQLRRSDARAIARLSKLRQSLGTRLLAEAQQAYEHALRSAGVKVVNRARNRTSPTRQRQVAAAVDGRKPLGAVMASVGITEEEALRHAFDTFTELAIAEVRRYRSRQAEILVKLDTKLVPADDPPPEIVADFLVAGLTAMVRARLQVGDAAMVAAAAVTMVPRKVPRAPRMPDYYDLPAGLPDPDELSAAAARLVRNALFAADGRVHVQFPATPDRLPTVVTSEATMPESLEEKLVLEFSVAPLWRWEHGYYGEPMHPLDAHEALDGYETTDREGDPELANLDVFPDGDMYFPGDHDGCCCEWVVAVD